MKLTFRIMTSDDGLRCSEMCVFFRKKEEGSGCWCHVYGLLRATFAKEPARHPVCIEKAEVDER